ncbi:MAG: toll/interleukin-1 receptor domain-containing protein, partial [Phototrophicaceae bacterium]
MNGLIFWLVALPLIVAFAVIVLIAGRRRREKSYMSPPPIPAPVQPPQAKPSSETTLIGGYDPGVFGEIFGSEKKSKPNEIITRPVNRDEEYAPITDLDTDSFGDSPDDGMLTPEPTPLDDVLMEDREREAWFEVEESAPDLEDAPKREQTPLPPRPIAPAPAIIPPPAPPPPIPAPAPIGRIIPPAKQVEPKVAQANFSAFYPADAVPNQRYSLYVYAHTPEQLNTIKTDAQKFKDELGGQVNAPRTAKQSAELAVGTPITITPECDGLEFDPPTLTKKWQADWTRYPFEFRPSADHADDVLVIRVSVQVEGIEIAHIKCVMDVGNLPTVAIPPMPETPLIENPLAAAKLTSQSVTPYQRIFISYSRKDSTIAHAYKLAQQALGNEVFIDVDALRSGEDWRSGLARAIDNADILQLFWSEHSAESDYCRYEWEYALQHRCDDQRCEGFIRPVYWRKPMP